MIRRIRRFVVPEAEKRASLPFVSPSSGMDPSMIERGRPRRSGEQGSVSFRDLVPVVSRGGCGAERCHRPGVIGGSSGQEPAPALITFHVTDRNGKSYRTRIGAAWDHDDAEDLTLQLDLVPVNREAEGRGA